MSSISSPSTSSSSSYQQYAFANWKCQTLERHLRVSKLDFVCCPTNVRAPASWNKHTYKGFSKWQIFNARSVKPCFVFGLAHPFSLLHQSFLQNLKKLDYIWFGQCPFEQTIFQKGAYVLLRPQKKVILMWIPSFLVSKNPTCIFYHCRSLKVLRMCCCVCRKPFLLFWFLCFFAWRPEQIQKLVCCLFVCLFVCLPEQMEQFPSAN